MHTHTLTNFMKTITGNDLNTTHSLRVYIYPYTVKKRKEKGFLIYGEMHKYLVLVYEEAVRHI